MVSESDKIFVTILRGCATWAAGAQNRNRNKLAGFVGNCLHSLMNSIHFEQCVVGLILHPIQLKVLYDAPFDIVNT